MSFQMFPQRIFPGEHLVTNFTRERRLPFVFDSIVPPQVPPMDVGRTTLATFERLFPQMFLHVKLQQIIPSEGNRTQMAFEGTCFTFLVDHLMLLQEMFLLETSVAEFTFKSVVWDRMVFDVGQEVCFERKCLLTNGTLVGTYGFVALFVIGEYLPFVKRLTAMRALESILPKRPPLMFNENFLSFEATRAYFTLKLII